MLESNTTTAPDPASITTEEFLARNSHLSPLALCVAAEHHTAADVIEWRDAFCVDCNMSECAEGSAETLAAKIDALGWAKKLGFVFDLLCPKCREMY